jgi:hypothetical protein
VVHTTRAQAQIREKLQRESRILVPVPEALTSGAGGEAGALPRYPPRGSDLGLLWRVDLVHSEQVIKHIQRVH